MKKMHRVAVIALVAVSAPMLFAADASASWWGGDRWRGDDWWYDRPYYRGWGGPGYWGGPGGYWGGPGYWGGGPWGGYYGYPYGVPGVVTTQSSKPEVQKPE